MSLPSCLTLRTVKGSVLSWVELDNNFICLNNSINNVASLIHNGNMWHIPSGNTVTIETDYQYFIYGDMVIEGTLQLSGGSQLVVLNGDLIFSGGSVVGNGDIYNITLPDFDTKISGLTYSGNVLTIYQNDGSTYSTTIVSSTDITVTGGTYNPTTGTATFYDNNGGNFDVNGFLTGYTDISVSAITYDSVTGTLNLLQTDSSILTATGFTNNDFYVTGGTLVGGTLTLERQDGVVTIPGFASSFTGNTSGDCITDLYVTNLNSCSPLHIQPTSVGDVYIGENGGVNVGIGTSSPTQKLHVIGETLLSGFNQNVLTVVGSGSTSPIFTVEGSLGNLLSVYDQNDGFLLLVNNSTGGTVFEVNSDNTILMGNPESPSLNTTKKILVNSGATDIFYIPTSAYTGAFYEYVVNDGSNLRSGSIISVSDGGSIKYSQTTTTSIGNTSNILLSLSTSAGNMILSTSATTNNWEVKVIVRSI